MPFLRAPKTSILATLFLLIGCSKSSDSTIQSINDLEIEISGNVSLINIYFPNPETGLRDTMLLASPPQKIIYKKLSKDITIVVEKRNVIGNLTISTTARGQKSSKSTSAPFTRMSTFYSHSVGIASTSAHEPEEWPCGSHNGNQLTTGEKGGCYYVNGNGNKVYVERSECNCK